MRFLMDANSTLKGYENMKKQFLVKYEEYKTGKKEIKTTRILAEDKEDAFFFIVNADRWILEIKEVKA